MKRIVAVSVAHKNAKLRIRKLEDLRELRGLKVRPYLRGLIQGLNRRGYKIGDYYEIDFRQRRPNALNNAAAFGTPVAGDVIFCMSTTVVKAAADLFPATANPPIPIVGVVSAPGVETNGATPPVRLDQIANICGVSAKRSQTADTCFNNFYKTVPSLKEVKILHKTGYGPSEAAKTLVEGAAQPKGVTITPIAVTDAASVEAALDGLNERDPIWNPTVGIQVLPIDVCLAHAREIIDIAQGEKKLPTFFPVPDWVTSDVSSALGAYGVSQRTSGKLMAERVDAIWRNGDQVPTGTFVRWVDAPEAAFEVGGERCRGRGFEHRALPGIPTI